MSVQQAALVEFRHAYSRLCMAMVKALEVGKHRERVRGANSTRPSGVMPHDRYLKAVRLCRVTVNEHLATAKAAGVDGKALVESAQDARRMIEREWERNLPMGPAT